MALPSGALAGFADGISYDKHRPSYPPEAVSFLLESINLENKTGARIIDLAAGTGKFTELLAARPEKYEIVAVEPHDGMRLALDTKSLGNVQVRKGFANDIPVEDAWADGLICAQSFHWFSTPSSLTSIARTLKADSALALIWNIEDYNNTLSHQSPHPWTLKLREILFDLDKSCPADTPALRFRNETWRQVFAETSGPFGQSVEKQFSWKTWLTSEELWSRYRTLSQIAALEGDDLAKVKQQFEDALREKGTEIDTDGRIAVRGNTLVVVIKLK